MTRERVERTILPNWRAARDELIQGYRPNQANGVEAAGGKYMDRYPLFSFDQLPPKARRTLGGLWTAYELMLKEPKKQYIPNTIIGDFGFYLRGWNFDHQNESLAVADFGCGNGGMTRLLVDEASRQEMPSSFFLIDRSPAALDQGLMRFQKEQFSPVDSPNSTDSIVLEKKGTARQVLEFMQRNITDTGLPDGSMDVVTAINVLHHLTSGEIMGASKEIHRVLKPGGLFIIEDVAQLPDNPFGKLVLPKIIDRAVSIPTMRKLAEEAGVEITDDFLEGARLFIHDARRAFVQAMTLDQFEEILKESNLGPSLESVRSLKSPKLPWKFLFPSMNYALGYKTETF